MITESVCKAEHTKVEGDSLLWGQVQLSCGMSWRPKIIQICILKTFSRLTIFSLLAFEMLAAFTQCQQNGKNWKTSRYSDLDQDASPTARLFKQPKLATFAV